MSRVALDQLVVYRTFGSPGEQFEQARRSYGPFRARSANRHRFRWRSARLARHCSARL